MIRHLRCAFLLLVPFPATLPTVVRAQQATPSPAKAESLYRAGRFAAADSIALGVLKRDGRNLTALSLHGRVALLANQLPEAERTLTAALEMAPSDSALQVLLGEVYYRRDDFTRAATFLRATGRTARAKQLESFAGRTPYDMGAGPEVIRLPFVQTDPLPVIQMRINGSDPVYLLLDTGGAELLLDPEFAKDVGVEDLGGETGMFAGGRTASVGQGRVDSLEIGGLTVRNVPVNILPTRRFSAVAQGRRLDGIVGTVFLYHFIATIDYPGGALVLRRRTPAMRERMEKELSRVPRTVVPFWMAGDHFMVAEGRVNGGQPVVLFVDTGFAGGGFTCPESTLREAGITVDSSKVRESQGGGGGVRSVPLVVAELQLGSARQANIPGAFGLFPPSLEYGRGFRIGGLVSHVFFRSYALTLDFDAMRYSLAAP